MTTKSEEREVVVACALGDCCVSPSGCLSFTHSPRQEDWLDWKIKTLESLRVLRGKKFSKTHTSTFLKQTGKSYPQFKARMLGGSRYLTHIGKWVRRGNSKSVVQVLKYIRTPLSLAILFADDGVLLRKKKKHRDGTVYFLKPSSVLCTNSFPVEEVQMIRDRLLEVFDIEGSLQKQKGRHVIWFNAEDTKRIWSLINGHLRSVESMRSKFDLCVNFYGWPE